MVDEVYDGAKSPVLHSPHVNEGVRVRVPGQMSLATKKYVNTCIVVVNLFT